MMKTLTEGVQILKFIEAQKSLDLTQPVVLTSIVASVKKSSKIKMGTKLLSNI